MAPYIWRQKLRNNRQVIGIIQDQQPSSMLLQPRFDRSDSDHLLLRILLWQVEQSCDDDEGRDEPLTSIGAGPEHSLVIGVIPIGVFHCQLCLANAPQPIDRLWLRNSHRLPCSQ